MKPYYTLVRKDHINRKWTPQFGDYSRAVVQAELDSYVEDDEREDIVASYKIIATDSSQAAIDLACEVLNRE